MSYHVGREAQSVYGEHWNGVQTGVLHHKHHFGAVKEKISPYATPGDPASGVLPRISTNSPGEYGQGDQRVQPTATGFVSRIMRPTVSHFPSPTVTIPSNTSCCCASSPPAGARTFEKFDDIPNHKTDVNNHGPMSFDNIGFNYDYPDAAYERRREILREHRAYQEGWLYFIANDPRVPEGMPSAMQTWGLARDEFKDNDHWPHRYRPRSPPHDRRIRDDRK